MDRQQTYDDGVDDGVHVLNIVMGSLPSTFTPQENLAATAMLARAASLMRELQEGKRTLRMFTAKPRKRFLGIF